MTSLLEEWEEERLTQPLPELPKYYCMRSICDNALAGFATSYTLFSVHQLRYRTVPITIYRTCRYG
jgi:hypothetical protein